LFILGGAVLVAVTAADAQVIQPPPRSTGGLFGGRPQADPNRTTQQLSLFLNGLGGYDDNVSPEGGSVVPDPTAPQVSSYSSSGSVSARYWRGRTTRFFEATGGAFLESFQEIDVNSQIGGDLTARGMARIRDRFEVLGSARARYFPTFSLVPGAPVGPEGPSTPTDPTVGVSEMASVNSDIVSAGSYDWNLRQRTSGIYTYASRVYVEGAGGLDVRSNELEFSHLWGLTRSVGIEPSYRYLSQRTTEALGSLRPLDAHTVSLGLELQRRISPTRRFMVSGGGGVMRVDTVNSLNRQPFRYNAPTAYGSARLDLGRTWAVSADVRHDVSMLEGLSPQPFLTTTATVWAGGSLGRRVTLTATGNLSDGSPQEGDRGSFRSGSAIAQLQYAFSRCCSVIGNYSYYDHILREVAAVPIGFPRNFERNALRFGLTVWLPLYGSFPPGPQPVNRN
jgi:hypothetical protein